MARLGNPPLTTVRQPLEMMAETAVKLLVDRLRGRDVPWRVELPAEALIRQSCGCHRPLAVARLPDRPRSGTEASEFLVTHEARIIDVLSTVLGPANAEARCRALRLLAALRAELGGEADAFDTALGEALEDIREDNESHQALQEAIGRLREELREFGTPELGEIWDRARSRIALANTCSQPSAVMSWRKVSDSGWR